MLVVSALMLLGSRNSSLAERFIIDKRTDYTSLQKRLVSLLQVAVGERNPRCDNVTEKEEEEHDEL